MSRSAVLAGPRAGARGGDAVPRAASPVPPAATPAPLAATPVPPAAIPVPRAGRRHRNAELVWLLVSLVAACATTASLKQARGTGLTRVFQGSFEEVWEAALESVRGLGFERVRANREERWIASVREPSGPGPGAPEHAVSLQADQGERVGVFIDSIAPGRWQVEVVTVRLFVLDPAKLQWAEEIFFSMEMRLDPERHLRIPDSALEEPPLP